MKQKKTITWYRNQGTGNKMLSELGKRIDVQSENFNKELWKRPNQNGRIQERGTRTWPPSSLLGSSTPGGSVSGLFLQVVLSLLSPERWSEILLGWPGKQENEGNLQGVFDHGKLKRHTLFDISMERIHIDLTVVIISLLRSWAHRCSQITLLQMSGWSL